MNLPIGLEYEPMEAESAQAIPQGESWQYEPKWDGFRCLAFRDGTEIELASKSGQKLARYFPEIVQMLERFRAERFVIDCEIVELINGNSDFDLLLQRIHPADSRIRKLAKEWPATLVAFDLLVTADGLDVTHEPLSRRRSALEAFAAKNVPDQERFVVCPKTTDFKVAKQWFEELAGALDGVIAKRTDLPYGSGTRNAMLKIKNLRTADCVVGGFRYGSKDRLVASLLLGLYDEQGQLHHVGFTSGLAKKDKPELTEKLEALIEEPGFTGARPGGPSRWSTERSVEWKPLAPKLVIEIQFDHFSGHRFRHGTRILRWRPDKAARQCTFEQVRHVSQSAVSLL